MRVESIYLKESFIHCLKTIATLVIQTLKINNLNLLLKNLDTINWKINNDHQGLTLIQIDKSRPLIRVDL